MINWKNTPIDQLTKAELRQALKESVGFILDNKTNNDGGEWLHTFSFGIVAGVLVSVVGISLTQLV